jgi:GT2 family glycosyltransferase
MELPADVSVLVLLVVTDGARWLPEVLGALRAQDHRPIDILAVDNASTDGSGALLAEAFGGRRVISLERRTGYGRALAAALKVAVDRGLTPDVFLLVHDDCAPQPGALTAMIEEMARGRAAIVGAKLVEWDDPGVLQDMGQTTDRNGRVVARIEHAELDQGQYEGAQEVLYATSAAMLIHRDVVEKVGLFDLRYVVLRDDFDLCWRAKMAGFSTVVTTAAVARHASAGVRGQRGAPLARRARYFAERNTLASLLKNYSLPRLLAVLPFALAASLGSAVLYLATGKRSAAAQVLEALQWNVVHLPSTLRQRRRAQHARSVPDAEVGLLMDHSAMRMRAQVERALETIAPLDEAGPGAPGRTTTWIRAHPVAAATIAASILWIVGARTIFHSAPLAGLDLAPFPSSWRAFLAEFASGWRGAAHGGAAPATPGLVALGALSFVCFGSGWLAERVLLCGLPVLAAVSMLRAARAVGLPRPAARVAVVCYAASPLVLGLFGEGRLPDLVLAAAAPVLLLPLLRAAGIAPSNGWRDAGAGIAGLAFVAGLAPYALPFVAVAGLVIAAGAASVRAAARTALMVAGAFAMLLPWSVELLRPGSPLGAGGADSGMRMRDLLGLTTGFVHPVPWFLSYAIAGAAIAGFAAARDERRTAARALGSLAAVGLFGAWGIARGVSWIGPRPAPVLVATAFGASILAALAFEAARPALRARAFGPRHAVAAVLGIAIVLQFGATALWVASGRHPGLVPGNAFAPSLYASDTPRAGAFRIAWIGGTGREPSIDVTGPEGETARAFLARGAGKGADALRRTLAAIVGGGTESGGRLLATFGVRYVVVRPDADPDVASAIARQIDLTFFQRLHGSSIYRDNVGLSIASEVEAPGWVAASAGDIDAAAGAETTVGARAGFVRDRGTTYDGALTPQSRYVFLGEDYSPNWVMRAGTTTVPAQGAFGWSVRFKVPSGARSAHVEWHGQTPHRLALLLELLGIVAFAAAWSRRAAVERGER